MDVALRIRDLLTDRDITTRSLAAKFDMNEATLGGYLRGTRTMPYEIFIKLADYLDVTTDYLLGRTEEPSVPLRLSRSERLLIEELRTLNPDQKALAAQTVQFMARQNSK